MKYVGITLLSVCLSFLLTLSLYSTLKVENATVTAEKTVVYIQNKKLIENIELNTKALGLLCEQVENLSIRIENLERSIHDRQEQDSSGR